MIKEAIDLHLEDMREQGDPIPRASSVSVSIDTNTASVPAREGPPPVAAVRGMARITTDEVVSRLTAYLHHEVALGELVDWAEEAMMEGEFEDDRYGAIRDVVSRLGVADVRAFGLTWEDCEGFLGRLGCTVRVEVTLP